MAFDANRPVPWKRLLVPFAIYAVVATAAFTLFGSQTSVAGIVLGVLMGGTLYLGIAVLLVKFGWNPPQWGGPRPERPPAKTTPSRSSGAAAPEGARPKPAPTARTNAGNPKAKRSR